MTSEDFFEKIQTHYYKELPFVAYRKPNESVLKGLIQKNSTLHLISDYTESGFVFSPFDDTLQTILIPYSDSELLQSSFDVSNQIKSSTLDKFPVSEGREVHIQLVQKGIDAIYRQEFKKVVVSRCESIPLSESNPIDIYKSLLNTYASAFVYCWFHPKVGLWLGATPETLLNIEGNRLTTMALAGTQKFKRTLDVKWQSKEKEEQQIVTDYLVSSLQSSVSSLKVSKVETIKAGNLLHLKTVISGTFNFQFSNLKQLLTSIHPTPAVCGLPKDKAKQFIVEQEHYSREYYTGFLGELNIKERRLRNSNRYNVENDAYSVIKTVSNLYVNLRCMQLKDNQAFIYVGGGITKDSVPEMEWEETVSKSEVIKSIL